MFTNQPLTLDPDKWSAMHALAHRMVDDAIEHMKGVRDRPVRTEMPDETRARFRESLPSDPTPLDSV